MREFPKRVLVAIVLIPIVVGCAWAGGPALVTLLSLASGLAAWEFYRLAEACGARPLRATGVVISALVPVAVHARFLGLWVPPVSLVALVVPALFTLALFARGASGRPLSAVSTTLAGVVYTGGMLSSGYALRYHEFVVDAPAGTAVLLLPVVVTWINDSGAFLAGRTFGTTKLMPTVSPAKTWAGAYGAVSAALLGTWIFVTLVLPPLAHVTMRPLGIVVTGLALSLAAQVGDLAESMLKREAGVKDSSHLIPGHGGMLDRVDSLLFTLPVGYVLLGYFLRYTP